MNENIKPVNPAIAKIMTFAGDADKIDHPVERELLSGLLSGATEEERPEIEQYIKEYDKSIGCTTTFEYQEGVVIERKESVFSKTETYHYNDRHQMTREDRDKDGKFDYEFEEFHEDNKLTTITTMYDNGEKTSIEKNEVIFDKDTREIIDTNVYEDMNANGKFEYVKNTKYDKDGNFLQQTVKKSSKDDGNYDIINNN